MSKIYTSVEQLIGGTPLLELTHIEKEDALSAKYGATVAITTHSITFRCKTEAELKALIKSLS